MAAAGVLAAKKQKQDAQQQLSSDIMRRNAQRLGGNTDMLDAQSGLSAINAQEGSSIGNSLLGMVGKMGQPQQQPSPQGAAAPMQPPAAQPSPEDDPFYQRYGFTNFGGRR